MMRIIIPSALALLSTIIIILSLELNAWSSSVALKDDQGFIKVKDTMFNNNLWEEYLGHELELNLITSNVFKINLTVRPNEKISILLDKLEKLRYTRIHKLDIIANQRDQTFEISTIMTLN